MTNQEAIERITEHIVIHKYRESHAIHIVEALEMAIKALQAQSEIVRCKDCKFYSPMNRETKTGICSLLMHQNFGDDWFCAGAERREE